MIGAFYTVGQNVWDAYEYDFEGAFAIVAVAIITPLGVGLLRVGKMQAKWRLKLARALEKPAHAGGRSNAGWVKRFAEKHAMAVLPLVTVLREGVEAMVFIAGVRGPPALCRHGHNQTSLADTRRPRR